MRDCVFAHCVHDAVEKFVLILGIAIKEEKIFMNFAVFTVQSHHTKSQLSDKAC